ncbi:MAG: NAD(P)-dependent oxidoreductase, partial [Pseudomonadota bacterium]
MAKVAWIGLGVMGFPMAGHIAKTGTHDVVVYNRTSKKAHKWVTDYGTGRTAATPLEAARDADFVICCVGNDDDLRAVTTGENGAFKSQKPGTVFIDHTTASAEVARELHEAARTSGFAFLDAPVSGGQAGAENGALTIMCGGTSETYNKAAPVMAHYAKKTTLMGDDGAGQLTKMVNQICIAGLLQGLSEGLHFAEQSGLDPKAVIETISK